MYKVKAKLERTASGKTKFVAENYLVDAESVTEAEARTITHLEDLAEKNFFVVAASPAKIADLVEKDGEIWYSARYVYETDNGKKVKKVSKVMFIRASDIDAAFKAAKEELQRWQIAPTLTSIGEAHIVEYIERQTETPTE